MNEAKIKSKHNQLSAACNQTMTAEWSQLTPLVCSCLSQVVIHVYLEVNF